MVASHQWIIHIADEAETAAFAHDLTHEIGPNDVITLSGDLGAGKTTCARSMIRALMNDPELDVPSPTFTLMQVYEAAFPIVHADLYRIKNPDELHNLGWDDAAEGAALLVEWAQNAGTYIPADHLDLEWRLNPAQSDQARILVMTAYGTWVERMKRARMLIDFLLEANWHDAERHFMLGDASARAYERLIKPDGTKAILMISPKRADGPPIRYGKPYSHIARLSEDISAFIAIDKGLQAQGYSVPTLYAYDRDKGLAILEDLGAGAIVDDNGPIIERYKEAAILLADLHQRTLPSTIEVDHTLYTIPPYDLDALIIEIELFTDWYIPHICKIELSSAAKAIFVNIWRAMLASIAATRSTWVLRDYHSPNIIWLEDRKGLSRIGLIDFQDCVLGHPAYDLVSLTQDARVSISDDLELHLLAEYITIRRQEPNFDFAEFMYDYAILGAQRATKILGIFARLDQRDHKPHYRAHIPRVEDYLRRNLKHILFEELCLWFKTYAPDVLRFDEPLEDDAHE
jgi:N-acetylmuramate 1-kinase